jgi:hypothetical protein
MFQSLVGVNPSAILFIGTMAYLLLSMYHIFMFLLSNRTPTFSGVILMLVNTNKSAMTNNDVNLSLLRYYSSLEVASEYFRSGADKISIGSDAVFAAEAYLQTGVCILICPTMCS